MSRTELEIVFLDLYSAAKALERRGWFKPSPCNDAPARHDAAMMRKAITAAGRVRIGEGDAA